MKQIDKKISREEALMKIEAVELGIQTLEKRNKQNEGKFEKIDVKPLYFDKFSHSHKIWD